MSDSAYAVIPIRADDVPPEENPDEVAHATEESLHEKLHPAMYKQSEAEMEPEQEPPRPGPLKTAIAKQDSLYKYISWDDPTRTFGSYLGLLGLLYALHHLHWTQLLLKMSATGLGAISLLAFVSRSTSSDFVAHSRPEYKKVPEDTLNATLSDIHDFVQYFALKLQRVIYGEDLGSTFATFLSLTTLFWLIKVISPFSLVVLCLSTIYLVPLLGTPRGRAVAQGAKVRTQSFAQSTADNARVMAHDSKVKATDLSSRAQHTMGNISGKVSSKTKSTADRITNKAYQTSDNLMAASHRLRRPSADAGNSNINPNPNPTTSSSSTDAGGMSAGDVVPKAEQRSVGNMPSSLDGPPNAADLASKGDLSSATKEVADEIKKGDESIPPGYQSTTTYYRGSVK